MKIRRRRRGRSGFTLVELVLATTIAMLLLGALYVAVDMQLRFAQNSRDLVEESTLARALLARMDADASQVVGLSDPSRYRVAAGSDALSDPSSTSSTASTSSTTPTTTGATGTTTGTTSSSTTSSSTTSATSTTDSGTSTNIVVPLGVQGDADTLHLFISRVPREVWATNTDTPPVVSDLRRVSYWLAGGPDNPTGLARQEVPLITSDDALQNLPPGIDNESTFVIAEEARTLVFQYFDGTNWQDSWDSTVPGADGVTPVGSPVAIAVTVGIAVPGGNGNGNVKTYRHVIAIASANGTTPQPTASTTGTSTTGTSSPSTTQSNTGGGTTP